METFNIEPLKMNIWEHLPPSWLLGYIFYPYTNKTKETELRTKVEKYLDVTEQSVLFPNR